MDAGVAAALITSGSALAVATVSPWVAEVVRGRNRAVLRTAIKEEIDLASSARAVGETWETQVAVLEQLISSQITELVARERAAAARREAMPRRLLWALVGATAVASVVAILLWVPGAGDRVAAIVSLVGILITGGGALIAAVSAARAEHAGRDVYEDVRDMDPLTSAIVETLAAGRKSRTRAGSQGG